MTHKELAKSTIILEAKYMKMEFSISEALKSVNTLEHLSTLLVFVKILGVNTLSGWLYMLSYLSWQPLNGAVYKEYITKKLQ